MKAAYFVGTARRDLAVFPESARRRAGYELFMAQVGREPADFKPIPSVTSSSERNHEESGHAYYTG